VFNPAKVNARNSAGLQGHSSQLSHSLFIRYTDSGQGHFFNRPTAILVCLSNRINTLSGYKREKRGAKEHWPAASNSTWFE
jgi:hypothetical protein